MRNPFRLAKVVGKSLPAIGRLRTGRKEKKFRDLGEKEKTRFNGKVSAHRVFGAVSYDLAEVRRIKTEVAGATVNDVMLTIVGGALQYRWRARRKQNAGPNDGLIFVQENLIRKVD